MYAPFGFYGFNKVWSNESAPLYYYHNTIYISSAQWLGDVDININ